MKTPYEAEMRLHEDRFDDHLTDDEVRERFAAIDRMASIHDPLGAGGVEDFARHGRPYIRSALGLIGIVVAVCGVGAVAFGLR